jgi:hypothetical protein
MEATLGFQRIQMLVVDLLIFCLLLTPSPARSNVLLFSDLPSNGSDAGFQLALNALDIDFVETNSAEEFASMIEEEEWDMVISNQINSLVSSFDSALSQYVLQGGTAIVHDARLPFHGGTPQFYEDWGVAATGGVGYVSM